MRSLETRTVTRWLTEKLPSGWAPAVAAGTSSGQRQAGDEERAPHRSAACARGAYRGEKRGLWASARRSHASASAVCPAARAAIPAW